MSLSPFVVERSAPARASVGWRLDAPPAGIFSSIGDRTNGVDY
jgi:hypothetical protein